MQILKIDSDIEKILKGEIEPHVKRSLDEIAQVKSKLQISFSGGKDSTALLCLALLAKKYNVISDFEVVHSNTLMEMPFLNNHVFKVKKWCESHGINFVFLTAQIKDRFMYNVFGRGLAIPNRNFRWCTDRLKIKPIEKHLKPDVVMVTGERLGESNKRDIKLKNSGCGSSNECGLEDQKKITPNLIRPLVQWSTCQVWDFIALMDLKQILPDVFSNLSEIYSINETETGSLRTGCIGCPLVNKDKSLDAFVDRNPGYDPLKKVKDIYTRLTLPENRLKRKGGKNKKIDNSQEMVSGAIKLSARAIAFKELCEIEKEVKKFDPNFQLIQPEEKLEIQYLMDHHTYPKGYLSEDPQIIQDIADYENLKKKMTSTLSTVTTSPKPFLKWAGGKAQLLPQLTPLLPQTIARYCEPFVGGGAMLWRILTNHKPQQVMICDINPDLILTYKVVRDWCDHLIPKLTKLEREYHALPNEAEKREYFTMVRSLFNLRAKFIQHEFYGVVNTLDERFIDRAAQVIFLNKTCFNGLWRVRKTDGKFFNSPFGKYDTPKICDAENLNACAIALRGVEIVCGDFRKCTKFIDSETFVYLDPPYLPVSKTSNFTGYSEGGWSEEDAIALRDWMLELSKPDPLLQMPAIVLSSGLTNIWDELTEDDFEVVEVSARRNINCDGDRRGNVTELVFRNFYN